VTKTEQEVISREMTLSANVATIKDLVTHILNLSNLST